MRLLLLTAALIAVPHVVRAQSHYSVDDTHAAIVQIAEERAVSERLLDCIVRIESTYRPYAVGAQGEEGPVQLHPRGLGRDFRARGYTDPYSPYQSVDYLAVALTEGLGFHWASYGRCR